MTTSLTFHVPFIDHTNVPRANVVTEAEKLAPGICLVRVQRDRDGKIAKALMLLGCNVAFKETTEYAEYFLRYDEFTFCLD